MRGIGDWSGGNDIGTAYRVREEDLERVGNCWMKGRLRVGDVVLCLKHSGDCFFDYILLEEYENAWKGIPGSRFGAYSMSNPECDFSDREFHLLAAGETVRK